MFDFLNTYSTPIKIGCIIAGALACFFFGYDKAETEYLLEIESMKLAHAQAVIDAQNEAKVKYENDIQKLSQALVDAHRLSDDRMRQLQTFRDANRNLEACLSDRSELASLAIEVERLLNEADRYLESLVK